MICAPIALSRPFQTVNLYQDKTPGTRNQEPETCCVIVSNVKFLGLYLLLACSLASCQKSLNEQVRDQIRTLDHAELDPEDIEILEVRGSGDQAVVQVTIKTAIRMRKEGNKWVMREIRLGDRRWESVDRILEAIERSRQEQTAKEMDQVTAGIKKYRQEEGNVPLVKSFEKLVDTLNPEYLSSVIRIDAWWNPYRYRVMTVSEFELRSAGPDGKFGTDDDLVKN